MASHELQARQSARLSGYRVQRRWLLLFGAAAVPTVMGFAACGSEGTGGTREDPHPYNKERMDRLRTAM